MHTHKLTHTTASTIQTHIYNQPYKDYHNNNNNNIYVCSGSGSKRKTYPKLLFEVVYGLPADVRAV